MMQWHRSTAVLIVSWFYRGMPVSMMTSSNGSIFRVTGPLCGEFTGHRWIPLTKASDAELWCFFYLRLNKWLSTHSWGWWFETPSRSLWRQSNEHQKFEIILIPMEAFTLKQILIISDNDKKSTCNSAIVNLMDNKAKNKRIFKIQHDLFTKLISSTRCPPADVPAIIKFNNQNVNNRVNDM